MIKDKRLREINEVASIILKEAILAESQDTFAVGGALINNTTGEVIHSLHNNVIKHLDSGRPFIFDPTAHGEQQLVYWYYDNKDRLRLPEPEDLTVITSLDPCIMCTGALLTAGFNVGVVAADTYAGVNFDLSFSFHSLPENLAEKVRKSFGYYASEEGSLPPDKYIRPYCGGKNIAFNDTKLTCSNLASCGAIFDRSAKRVREEILINNAAIKPGCMKDPAKLSENSSIKLAFRRAYQEAYTIITRDYRTPGAEILKELKQVLYEAESASNAVAFIDCFGNLVLCMADTFDISPVHTAFMNLTRQYSTIRWNLINDFKEGDDNPLLYLPHPTYGTFVFLHAPNSNETTTIMDLGAYRVTTEGPSLLSYPFNLQFYYPPRKGSFEKLVSIIQNLPPFYSQSTKIYAMQVPMMCR